MTMSAHKHDAETHRSSVDTRRPFLGYGLGLRPDYYDDVLGDADGIDWLEVTSENYMVAGGKPLYYLDQAAERFPLVMHGVSLSVGSTDPLDRDYLVRLKALADRVQPAWVSDHLCWTGQGGYNLHDLLPLPYNQEAVRHVADRVARVQDILGRRILLENVSSYLNYKHSDMTEWEFLSHVVEEADCLILLDINNIYVSAVNHGFDSKRYIDHVPPERVWQFHLAGHTRYEDFAIDTHDQPVPDPVWELYEYALGRFGPVSAMIERDDNMPSYNELRAELNHARRIGERVLG